MRNFKFFAMAALLAVATSASAQFTNTTSAKSSSSASVNTDGWSTVWAEWNPSTLNYDAKGADDQSFTGLSVGYSKAFSVTQNLPLFAEVGLGLQYSFYSEDYGEGINGDEVNYNFISAKVPVNLMYAFQIPNSSVSLIPFVGVNLRYNFSGKEKLIIDEGMDIYEDEYDLFDKDGADWKRFQLGWNIGVKARFGENFLVGLSYGSDFSEIAKKTKISTTSISLGYTF